MRPLAVQLYSLRRLPTFEAQLAAVAEAGYAGVETLHDHGLEAERLHALLQDHGLRVASSHVSLELLEGDPAAVAAFHRRAGTPLLVVPYLAPDRYDDTVDSWRRLGRKLEALGRAYRDEGLQLGYHNHDFELRTVGGALALDLLLAETTPENLVLELDLGWVARAGHDPRELLARYAGRCPRAHLKDLAAPGGNRAEGGWADVGHGTLDWPALLPAAEAAGAEWFVVEHDEPAEPARSIARSSSYLRALERA